MIFKIICQSLTFGILVTATSPPSSGNDNCPCLEGPLELNKSMLFTENLQQNMYEKYLFEYIQSSNTSSMFGVGCKPHNHNIGYCDFLNNLCEISDPKPKECDNAKWCPKEFCFVDTRKCTLLHRSSPSFSSIDYSFATCGKMDFFVESDRFEALRGKTVKVGYLANTGGYVGSYHVNGSFAMDDLWTGPLVDFVEKVSELGGFTIQMVEPPDTIVDQAIEYYNSTSVFDLCLYATSLGHIDMCLGSYGVTEERITSGKWFKLGKKPINLVTFDNSKTSWVGVFFGDATLLLKPFSSGVWLLIFLLFIPIMALLMVHNERGVEGGSFPNRANKHLMGYILESFYDVLLSLFDGYGKDVISKGGKVHLLGIGFFNLVLLSVYTANLAAILTANKSSNIVTTLKGVRNNGYKICARRVVSHQVAHSHPFVTDLLLKDPVDGLPGFVSLRRTEIIDRMKATVDVFEREEYCEVALSTEEDLVTMQSEGNHCNKTTQVEMLGFATTGFPLSPRKNEILWPMFQSALNEGIFDELVEKNKPINQCRAPIITSANGELFVTHLAGVWLVPLLFALVGLIVHKYDSKKTEKPFSKRDESEA